MPIILLIMLLSAARFFELGPFAHMSWWWIGLLAGVAFLWFEVVEPIFGLDRKRADDRLEHVRRERVKQSFIDLHNRKK